MKVPGCVDHEFTLAQSEARGLAEGRRIPGVRISLEPAATVSGRVTLPGGGEPGKELVMAVFTDPMLRPTFTGDGIVVGGRTRKSGEFTFDNVPVRDGLWVGVAGRGDYEMAYAPLGDRPRADRHFEVDLQLRERTELELTIVVEGGGRHLEVSLDHDRIPGPGPVYTVRTKSGFTTLRIGPKMPGWEYRIVRLPHGVPHHTIRVSAE